jgi:Rrf2 family protein
MVSRAADYALRATLVLAGRPPGVRLSLGELAQETDVPSAFLYKILRTLVQKGLLTAHRGKTGGYELPAEAHDRSVLDVVDALDGLPLFNVCLLSGGCHRAPTCPAHPVWVEAQARVRDVLGAARLVDLARGQAPAMPPAASRRGHRAHPGVEGRERLPRLGGRACVRLRRDDRLPAPPRGRDVPGVLGGPRGDGR